MALKASAGRLAFFTSGALIFAIAAYAAAFGVQTFIVLKLRRVLPQDKSLYALPQQIPSSDSSEAPGTTLSFFGYQFEAPWTGIENKHLGANVAFVNFNSGQMIMFANPATAPQPLKELTKGDSENDGRIARLLGNAALSSNYSLFDSVIRLTPRQLSVFMSRREAVRLAALLPLKLAFATNSETGLYSFAWPNIKGFQCGSPGLAKTVIVNGFGPNDRQIQLTFSTKEQSQSILRQSEINRVVQTFHSLSTANN